MKRRVCLVSKLPNFYCDDIMEELNVGALSRRKESAVPLALSTEERVSGLYLDSYPLALVLRLRVLQIVCGITAMIMGSVAFIEERHKFNMGLGVPAGGVSVLAAAVSIHTMRGWGVSRVAAGTTTVALMLWVGATCVLVSLVAQCVRTIVRSSSDHRDKQADENSIPSSRDLTVIACVQIVLAVATLISAAVCARIDMTSS